MKPWIVTDKIPIVSEKNFTIFKWIIYKRSNPDTILNLIKRKRKQISLNKKSQLLKLKKLQLKKKNKLSLERATLKSIFKPSWLLNGLKINTSILTNSKSKISTSFSLDTLMLVNLHLLETSWNNSVKLTNNNGQEINNKPSKITCKHGNWPVLLTLILTKEREVKLSNTPNLTSLFKTEDSQSSMPQATKTTSLTWSWVPVKLILLFLSSLLKKANSKLDLTRMDKPKNTLC